MYIYLYATIYMVLPTIVLYIRTALFVIVLSHCKQSVNFLFIYFVNYHLILLVIFKLTCLATFLPSFHGFTFIGFWILIYLLMLALLKQPPLLSKILQILLSLFGHPLSLQQLPYICTRVSILLCIHKNTLKTSFCPHFPS